MITAEDIEKYLVEGHVEYIKRATFVNSPYNKGYYIGTSAHIHDVFIRADRYSSLFIPLRFKGIYT